MTQRGNDCGLCPGVARSTIDFHYGVPNTKLSKHEGAEALALQMPLCEACGQKVYKHLKRFFGRTHFRPIGQADEAVAAERLAEPGSATADSKRAAPAGR